MNNFILINLKADKIDAFLEKCIVSKWSQEEIENLGSL